MKPKKTAMLWSKSNYSEMQIKKLLNEQCLPPRMTAHVNKLFNAGKKN
jgi:hypothetical protein